MAKASIDNLRRCGLSQRKAEYIIGFSEEVAKGSFDPGSLRNLKQEEITEKLTKFRGIGRWTAELVGIACLDKGQGPADDLGVRKAISRYYFDGKLQDVDTIRKFMNNWMDAKGITVYLLYANRPNLKVD